MKQANTAPTRTLVVLRITQIPPATRKILAMNHLLRYVVKPSFVFLLAALLGGWIYSAPESLHVSASLIRSGRLWTPGYTLFGAAILWWPFRRYATAPWIGLALIGAGVVPVLFALDGISLVAFGGWIATVFLARAWLELTRILNPAFVVNAGGLASALEPAADTGCEFDHHFGGRTICPDQIAGMASLKKDVPHPRQDIIGKGVRSIIVFVDEGGDVLRYGRMLRAAGVTNIVVIAIDLVDHAVCGVLHIAATDDSDFIEMVIRDGQFEQQIRLDIPEEDELASYVRARVRMLAGDVFAISRYTMDYLVGGLRGRSFADADAVLQRVIDNAAIRQLREGSATITVADASTALASISATD
jgi:hypothetical protein